MAKKLRLPRLLRLTKRQRNITLVIVLLTVIGVLVWYFTKPSGNRTDPNPDPICNNRIEGTIIKNKNNLFLYLNNHIDNLKGNKYLIRPDLIMKLKKQTRLHLGFISIPGYIVTLNKDIQIVNRVNIEGCQVDD